MVIMWTTNIGAVLFACRCNGVTNLCFFSLSPLSCFLALASLETSSLLTGSQLTLTIYLNHLNALPPTLFISGSLHPSLSVSQLCTSSPFCGVWRTCSSSSRVRGTAQQVSAHSIPELPLSVQTSSPSPVWKRNTNWFKWHIYLDHNGDWCITTWYLVLFDCMIS